MATRKKKIEETPNVDNRGWPKIQQGTHLTVKTFEDGRTELVWDDEQLLKEVQDAINAYEATQLVGAIALGGQPTTKTRKKKETI